MNPGKDVVLSTQALTRSFNGQVVVDRLDISVYEGEIFGLLGPNGAGKTTTISMLCGFLKPDQGQIFYKNRPVRQAASIKPFIGVCPQTLSVWKNLTCLEQLIFMGEMYDLPARLSRQRAAYLLELLGLAEKRDKLAGTLSGGMLRRLNLALALVHDPPILILDEPEAGLDPQSRILVREFIRRWANQATKSVILTTHNMDEAERLAQRIAIIDHGRLLVVDTPDGLKQSLGAGDVLEITWTQESPLTDPVRLEIQSHWPGVAFGTGSLTVRVKDPLDVLSSIKSIFHHNGIDPGEIRLRPNSLEDVFIALTGRTLRE